VFGRELWSGAVQAEIPPAADVPQAFEAAWAARDSARIIAFGRAARARGELNPKNAARFRTTLSGLGLHEELLADLDHGGPPPDPVAHAAALAATGATEAALAALSTAAGAEAASLRGLLEDSPQAVGWASAMRLIEQGLELKLPTAVIPILRSAVRAGLTGDAEAIQALGCAQTMLHGCHGAAAAMAIMEAIEPLFVAQDERACLGGAMASLRGEDGDACLWLQHEPHQSRRYHLQLALAMAYVSAGRWPLAIRMLGRLNVKNRSDGEFRTDLARCVGRDVLGRQSVSFARPNGSPRIFDVFPFNGEFTLLELKLRQTADWVDTFVIIEAGKTFTGQDKPLYFQERRDQFSDYADKIVHIVVPSFPEHVDTAWAREFHQRDQGVRGLIGRATPDDWVIVSDVDEMVRREALEGLAVPWATCAVRTYGFFLNYLRVGEARQERKIPLIRARFLAGIGLSQTRHLAAYSKSILEDAGWHFHSVMGAADLRLKFDSFSHEEWGGMSEAYYRSVLDRIRAGEDYPRFVRVPIDQSFPGYVVENQDRLAEWILPVE
jgi:beta-1,4-mannosyl-glycoprotein beta-1,4-N-acetylglucosaminyltransferase